MNRRALLALSFFAASCSAASADPPTAVPPRVSAASVPETGRARVRYALASHFERAELSEGSTRHVDFGTAAAAQHTAGGWLSNVGPDREVDGASATLTTRSRARFAISADGEAAELSLRLRAFRPGTAHIYLDGQPLTTCALRADEWQVVRVEATPTQLTRGEHEVLLRMDHGSRLEDGQRAYLAVDWLRLGPPGTEAAGATPHAHEVEGVPALSIPSGWSVAYPFEVPAAARLRGVARGTGQLEVWAEGEGAPPAQLAVVSVNGRAQPLDVDLGPLAGSLSRLSLRARGGDLSLFRPAVVTLDRREAAAAPRRPRNVVVYLIDTLRADRLHAYAPDSRVRVPAFDRLTRDASTFLSARSQENWTKPSVATLLSSLMPWQHTAFSDASVVPASVRLLPEMLKDRGFVTAGFVANGYVSDRFGFRRGWDHWRNYIREGRPTRGELVAADVLEWLDQRPAEQPFFLYVHAIDPHVPYRAPESYVHLYDPEPYHGAVDFSRDAALLERIKTGGLRLGARDRRHLEALYDAEVSYQDTQLGVVLEGLSRRGLADDTMVVITADHGEELFDHGSVGHGHSLYEELVHVPLVIRLPGAPVRRVEGAVGLVDVVPTILSALGEPVPEGLAGRSLLPMLRGDGEGAPPASVAGFMGNWRSVTVGRYKLISRSRGRHALYDLLNDPGEQHDLAAERPMTLAYLRGLLGLRLNEARDDVHRPSARRHRARDATIDRELEEQLRALGYVGTSRPR